MNFLRSWQRVAFAMAIVAPIAAFAQSKVADPSDPAAAAPASTYRSVFSGYVAYREATLVPWRKSNDAMLQTSGSSSAHDMGAMPKDMPMTGAKPMAPMPGRAMPANGMSPKAKE
jgi:hypothetical protein